MGAPFGDSRPPTLKKNYGQWDYFAFLAEPWFQLPDLLPREDQQILVPDPHVAL